jgi:PilZ domain
MSNSSVRFLARPNFGPYTGFIQNISKRGLTLLAQARLEPGTLLAIQFRTRHLGVSDILSAQVKQTTPGDADTWLLECKLSRNLTKQELASLSGCALEGP